MRIARNVELHQFVHFGNSWRNLVQIIISQVQTAQLMPGFNSIFGIELNDRNVVAAQIKKCELGLGIEIVV